MFNSPAGRLLFLALLLGALGSACFGPKPFLLQGDGNSAQVGYSGDIDVFHDREERVASAALSDVQTLEAAGYGVRWIRRSPTMYTAEITRQDAATRLEWVVDSDFRFFPTMRDETFGYVLHPIDLAMNKVMAAAGRREVRDGRSGDDFRLQLSLLYRLFE